jgi:hypothetical protein
MDSTSAAREQICQLWLPMQLLSFLGSKEDDITKSSQETAAVSDSGSVLRQEVNGWRREQHVENGSRKDDIAKSSSITESPMKDGQTTGREMQEVLLSPAGKSSNLRYYLKSMQNNPFDKLRIYSRIVDFFILFPFFISRCLS